MVSDDIPFNVSDYIRQFYRNVSVEDLREACLEADVKLIACQMTVDLFDMDSSDLIDGIDYAGAATFFEFAGESDVNLFI